MASSRSRFDPQPPDKSSDGSVRSDKSGQTAGYTTMAQEAGAPEGIDLLHIVGQALSISKDYQSRTIEKPLGRAYRAWQNQHAEGSKYLGTAWKGRSRLFVPKTRSAVRKNLATAAAALFSTEDVVNVSAEYEDDPRQMATAAVMKADLEYRLTRSSAKSGIPWYQIAMGACLDGQLTGVCISKQYWQYEEVPDGTMQDALVHHVDEETGEPSYHDVINEETGEVTQHPVMIEGQVPNMRVTRDRPMIDLHPIENAGLDPAAPWYSPVQLGRWFYMLHPMGLSDAKALMASGAKNGAENAWLDVPDELLLKGRIEEDRTGARRVREGGSDRYQDAKSVGELDIVWLQENFVRIEGVDYHFWSIGRHGYISKVRRTHEAYPELDGERPYVFGVSQLDTHRVFPMSPVEAWQPLQLELNDITNLRQDTLKRAIAPLAVVKRGKNVDLAQVQRRGQPETIVLADDPVGDINFVSTPGPSGAAYTETSVNNAMFDELAGVFSTSSVQSNRQLNETVGGMRLMSGAANAVSEFDLRMWVETWVEPVLRQIMHLVRRLESDERILAIAGQKARVWSEHGYMPGLSDFDQTEVSLRVNAGTGSMDPMQKIAKLKMALEMIAPMFEPMKAQGVSPKFDVIVQEIMGNAGFKDGRRFFEFGDPPEDQPDPAMLKVQEELKLKSKEIDVKQTDIENKFKAVLLELRSQEQRDQADNQTKIQIEQMRGKREVGKHILSAAIDHHAATHARAHEIGQAREVRSHAEKLASQKAQAQGGGKDQKAPAPSSQDRRQRIQDILAGKTVEPQQPTGTAMVPNGGQPPAPAARPDPAAAMAQFMPQIMQQFQVMQQRSAQTERALQAIMQHLTAPTEVVRDPSTGQATGVRKGGRFQQIVRGADGRVTGAAPLGNAPQQGAIA